MRKFVADDTTKQRCFQATAGPRDIMYLATGWVFSERFKGSVDSIGIKYQFIEPKHHAQLDEFNSLHIGQKKPIPFLQSVLDYLALAEKRQPS
eukprot:9107218-Alexandrium_andersonii.AAC.1